ncbi:hypothetical protein [Brevibacterium picturae]|uniref:ABC-2 type transport system permease protein n=1 Tax=Brevibacterium picturae TaxID=260553 RepID=A0ABN2CHQ5_9MICO
MVRTLIRWARTERRHTRTRFALVFGSFLALIGLALALGTASLGAIEFDTTAINVDLLAAAVLGIGMLWMMLPLLMGIRDAPEPGHLALLPLRTRTVMTGALVNLLLSPAAILTAIALLGLVVFSVRGGVLTVLVAVIATVLQLVLILLLSRVVVASIGASLSSRGWRVVGQAAFALIASCAWGLRFVFDDASEQLIAQDNPALSQTLRLLPTGWAVSAIDGATRADAVATLVPLFGLAAGCVLLWVAWSALVARSVIRDTTTRPSAGSTRRTRASASPLAASLRKELLLWVRDERRTMSLLVAICSGIALGVLMAAMGVPAMLPYGGLCALVVAIFIAANLYGFEADRLWLTLVTPGAARADVLAKQFAWLIMHTPPVLLLTVVPIAAAGDDATYAIPWVAATVPVMLGTGIAAAVLMSTLIPWAMPRTGVGAQLPFRIILGPLQFASVTIIATVVAIALLIPLAPVLIGVLTDTTWLQWVGIPLGIAIGTGSIVLATRPASRRLERRGPEILDRTTANAGLLQVL